MADNTTRAENQLVSFLPETTKKLPKAQALGIELLSMAEVNNFSVQGPAVAGIVYVRHPRDHHELIAFAEYDERMARDRYEEALRVFTSLGAARIVAKSHQQTIKNVGGWFWAKDSGFTIDVAKGAAWSLAFDQEGNGCAPVDPRPLRFRDIAGLEQVCEGVLHNGWKKGRIQITQSASLGVDGSLAGKLKSAGFQLGLSGTKVKVTQFVIEAAFTPEVSKDLDALVATTEPAAKPSRASMLRRKALGGSD
jgi:hypothetical protein